MKSSCNDEYSLDIASRSCSIFWRNSPVRFVKAFLPSAIQDSSSDDLSVNRFRVFFWSREDSEDSVILKQTDDQMSNMAIWGEEIEEAVKKKSKINTLLATHECLRIKYPHGSENVI
jgi:hypothetical protein